MKLALLLCAGAALIVVGAAAASRAPRPPERRAITAAVRADLGKVPVRCVSVRIRVSTVNNAYALAAPVWSTSEPCMQYAANGQDVVHERGGRWTIIWRGSDPPRCSALPAAVTRDLFRLPCLR